MDRLTAAQAAARLGVRTETLYAYVSRGLISRDRDGRGSSFDVLEVERFARSRRRQPEAGRGPAPAAGSDGSPLGVIDTDVALIDDGELWYRGIPVTDLVFGEGDVDGAGLGRFDAVVRWLLEGTARPDPDAEPLPSPGTVSYARRALDVLPSEAPAFSRLLSAVSALAATDPERFDLAPPTVARVAVRLIGGLTDALPLLGPAPAPHEPVAGRLWPRLTAAAAAPHRVAVLDAALVLLVDHDMAASTVAARAAASARAHPYAVVAAGLGALDSALHGAVSGEAVRMLREVAAGAEPAAAVGAAARRGGSGVPGFGQPLYPDGDPRARTLLSALDELSDPVVVRAREAAESVSGLVRSRTGLRPSIDFALATVMLAWDMPDDAGETVFAIARSAGWCVHALDEYGRTPLRLRPRGRYTGPDPADVQQAVSRAR
ncbi:citrate synthase [Streptomyces sp. MS2A]|nr:citrate synthase [Streptomyces sp. MS2A]